MALIQVDMAGENMSDPFGDGLGGEDGIGGAYWERVRCWWEERGLTGRGWWCPRWKLDAPKTAGDGRSASGEDDLV